MGQVLMAGLGRAVVLLALVLISRGSAEEGVSGGQDGHSCGDGHGHKCLDGSDGEDAMKNLEAAQVQMEQKLKIMTGFIDKELEKETFKQLPAIRRKRETSKGINKNPNPYKLIKPNEVKKVLDQMTELEKAFEAFVNAFERHANNKQTGDEAEPMQLQDSTGGGTVDVDLGIEPMQQTQDYPRANEEITEDGMLEEDVNEEETQSRIEATPPIDQQNTEEEDADGSQGKSKGGNAEYHLKYEPFPDDKTEKNENRDEEQTTLNAEEVNTKNLGGEPDEEEGKYFNQEMKNEEKIDTGEEVIGEEQGNENDEESKKYEDEQDATVKIEIVDEEPTTQNVQEGNTENPAGELDDKERKYDDHEDKDQINNDMHEEPQDEGGDEDQGYEKEK